MDYVAITKETWTKVTDASTDNVVVQMRDLSDFQFSEGEPSSTEGGILVRYALVLNGGTNGQEIWVRTNNDNVAVVMGAA